MKLTTLPYEYRKGFAGRHIISCGKPAKEEKDAFTTGNGTLLLSALGNPEHDRFTLRHEELYVPQWKEAPKAPEIAEYLEPVRKLLLKGEYKRAADLYSEMIKAKGPGSTLASSPEHAAIILEVNQPVEEAYHYFSTLDMRSSLVSVRWEDKDGGEYRREMFCSRADNLAAIRFTAPDGKLEMDLQGELPEPHFKPSGWGANYLPEKENGVYDTVPIWPDIHVAHSEEGILLDGIYDYDKGSFHTAVYLKVDSGKIWVENSKIRISGATHAVLLLRSERFDSVDADGAIRLMDSLRKMAPFDELLKRHEAIHRPIFERVSVCLGGPEEDYLLTTLELKKKQFASKHIVPAYMEAMVDMGRFFLMNECGKFPPIYGHVNININHQISCGNIASLPEMMHSFFNWIEWQLPDARENAKRILGSRGFFLATHPDNESGRLYHLSKYWPHHYWISSSGWCLNPFLEYYYCTNDEEFFKNRTLPLYYELSKLYEDFLTVRDENGKLLFVPSYSPENFPSNIPAMAVINATMDISVCREVFKTLLEYGQAFGVGTPEDRERWEALLRDLPEYLIDEHGELKEWARWDHEERYDHRHASHLYGAYPGDEFQPELDEKLYHAAYAANRMRAFGNESCHGIMHRAQSAARLKDSHLTNTMIRLVLESGYVNEDFTTVHNPYYKSAMPDGQGALPTALLESMFYSRPGFMEPLPARPEGSFTKGEIRGISARSFARVDQLSWNLEKRIIRLQITSLKDQDITLCYRNGYESVHSDDRNIFEEDAIHAKVSVKAGETISVMWEGVKQE